VTSASHDLALAWHPVLSSSSPLSLSLLSLDVHTPPKQNCLPQVFRSMGVVIDALVTSQCFKMGRRFTGMSENNIIITDSATEGGSRRRLIDLDLAKELDSVPSGATEVTGRALCNSYGSRARTSRMRRRFDMGVSCPRPLEASCPTTCVRTRYCKSVGTWCLCISRTWINKQHSNKFQKGCIYLL
jgi:hypothetical protein